jgi:hypothetical protein
MEVNHEWVPVGSPLIQHDAEFLRDLIHQAGFPARIERLEDQLEVLEGRGWLVWTPIEHEQEALNIRNRNFNGPTRRPTRRWSLTGLFGRGRPAA